eukprot:436799_1
MNISIEELEQKIKEYEEYIVSNNASNPTTTESTTIPTNINTNQTNSMSTQERDSIVEDLLTEYRSRNRYNSNQQPQIDNTSEHNYFSNLTNVSYDAYMINETEENKESEKDWIDTYQSSEKNTPNYKDLIFNDIQPNLRNLKKKQKENHLITQNVDITTPSDYIRHYNYPHKIKPHKGRRKNKKYQTRKRSNSLSPNKKKPKLKHKRSLAQQMADKESENLTFKPKINKYSFNRRIDPDVQRRLQIWNVQKKIKLTQQRKQKMEEDDCKIKEHFTFQPEVKTTIKKRSRPKTAKMYHGNNCNNSTLSIDSSLPVQHRLYEREYRRIEKLAKTKEIIEKQEMKQCSFKPKLQKSKLSTKIEKKFEHRKPIWERQKCIKKQKQNKRLASKNKITKAMDTDLTFKPKINKKSKEIVENAKLYTSYYPIDVSERLLLQNPKNKKIENENNNEKNKCKPYINPTSQKILKESILFSEASNDF